MMTHRDPNRFADRVVFWVCLITTLILFTHLTWEDGYSTGKNEPRNCATVTPKKSMYDMTPKQLRRMIRYEKMRGQP